MNANTFRPEIWSQALLAALRTNLTHPQLADERRRRGHSEVTPYTADELQARDKAIQAWQDLTDELLAKGWLENDYDGTLPTNETEHRTWVWDETEQEHQTRIAALPPLPDTITITAVKRGPLNDDSINAIREAL